MIDPYMKAVFIQLGFLFLVAAYGFYCAKKEREAFRTPENRRAR